MIDIGEGNGSNVAKLAVAAGLLLLGYTINSLWDLRDELSQLQGAADNTAQLRADVSTSLTVLGQHGTEFQDMRDQVAELRGEFNGLRAELLQAITAASRDRFYRTEWEIERRRIEERLGELARRVERLEEHHRGR